MFFNPDYFEIDKYKLLTMLPRNIVDNGKIFTYDRKYKIPKNPEYVLKHSPAKKYNPVEDEMDCDKYVRLFRAWLVKKHLGNLIGMEAIVTLPNKIGHDTICFIDINSSKDEHGKYNLIFGDLQTNKMIPKEISDRYIIEELRA